MSCTRSARKGIWESYEERLKKLLPAYTPLFFLLVVFFGGIIFFESFYKGFIPLFIFIFLLELGQELGLYKLNKVSNSSFGDNSGDSGSDCGGGDSCGGGGGDGGDWNSRLKWQLGT